MFVLRATVVVVNASPRLNFSAPPSLSSPGVYQEEFYTRIPTLCICVWSREARAILGNGVTVDVIFAGAAYRLRGAEEKGRGRGARPRRRKSVTRRDRQLDCQASAGHETVRSPSGPRGRRPRKIVEFRRERRFRVRQHLQRRRRQLGRRFLLLLLLEFGRKWRLLRGRSGHWRWRWWWRRWWRCRGRRCGRRDESRRKRGPGKLRAKLAAHRLPAAVLRVAQRRQ